MYGWNPTFFNKDFFVQNANPHAGNLFIWDQGIFNIKFRSGRVFQKVLSTLPLGIEKGSSMGVLLLWLTDKKKSNISLKFDIDL